MERQNQDGITTADVSSEISTAQEETVNVDRKTACIQEEILQNSPKNSNSAWVSYLNVFHYIVAALFSAITVYSFVQYSRIGLLLNQAIISVVFAFVYIVCLILQAIYVKKSKIVLFKTLMIVSIATLVATLPISIWLLLDVITTLPELPTFCYGPLAFVHENGTNIHWCTYKATPTYLQGQESTTGPKSNYHSVFVNKTQFDYQIPGMDTQFTYSLALQISKFVVMADTHTNSHYLSTMDTDFDLLVHCGDMSSGGRINEFALGFAGFPTKPVLMVMGNHDSYSGQFPQVNQREYNYYQQVRNIGIFFVYVQSGLDANAFQFLEDNAVLGYGADHIFIVVHHPVYSTGGDGSTESISKKMEQFIDSHPQLKFRAQFSGHDHVFAAFKRGQGYYFVNGAGGGGRDTMRDPTTYAGQRVWPADELHGPLTYLDEYCYGYEYHQDSWLKFTRTEVNFEASKIVYNIRDLDTGNILVSYDQPF
ncbi:Alkaline_phosphatase [Hexamita inflata]|uniref:Alkaline phosphatase n=1 Tax=Hexamita inflata TaxID=28002 RepID=A0AA86UX34_9EUKA|nr:Alkaline phosphatase [Hexamita inflata]